MFYFNFTTRTLTGGQVLDSTRTAGPFSNSAEADNFRAFLEHIYGAALLESGHVYASNNSKQGDRSTTVTAKAPFRVSLQQPHKC